MTTAYFDCFSGVSGDMMLGALIDAGLELKDLQTDIDALGTGAKLRTSSVDRCGIRATHVQVEVGGQPMNPAREQHMNPRTDVEHAHNHDHDSGEHHEHRDPDQHHEHTKLGDILAVINDSCLDVAIKETASLVFRRLTEAEAEVHGATAEEVGLHEVGSVDAIVDITGVIAGLRRMGVDHVLSSPLHVGTGTVQCAHGRYPVPVPGVLALCRNVPLVQTDIPSELVTPTGAALITTLADGFGPAPTMTLTATGYGAGGRNLPTTPNVVRLRLGEPVAAKGAADSIDGARCVLLEANLDDMNPEIFGYLFERLLGAGARDVFVTPLLMKKNRPGHLLSILADPGDVETIADIVLAETTSLGVRYHEVERRMLTRTSISVTTEFGPISVKIADVQGHKRAAPEYEDCAQLARNHKVPLQSVYAAALAAAREDMD
jgi:uncharacterized protein (TIGR00299 family) protein